MTLYILFMTNEVRYAPKWWKNVKPSLSNVKTPCKIVREHNKQTAILQKG